MFKIQALTRTAVLLMAALIPLGSFAQNAVEESVTVKTPTTSSMPRFTPRDKRYIIRPGDILTLTFELTPEMNEEVAVQPDGYISLHGAGDVHVGGLNLPQVREAISKKYAGVLANPQINVSLKDFEQPYFIVGGEVGKPGKYTMRGDTTVNEGVQTAGGFLASAKHSQLLLLRRTSDSSVEVTKINAKYMLASGDLREDLHLQSGDMIYVPKNTISKLKDWIPKTNLALGPGLW
jgi:polysaccharide export outer membrane protein